MSADFWNDYGFTTYDATRFNLERDQLQTELETVKTQAEREKQEIIDEVRARMNAIVELVMPLLEDLKNTAKEEYIRWPNRDRVLTPMIERIRELKGV